MDSHGHSKETGTKPKRLVTVTFLFRVAPRAFTTILDLSRLLSNPWYTEWEFTVTNLPTIKCTMRANNYQLFTRPNTSLIPSIIQCFLKLLGLYSVLCWIILFFIVTAIKLNLEWSLASSWNTNSSSISTWSFNRINFSIFKLKCISAFY